MKHIVIDEASSIENIADLWESPPTLQRIPVITTELHGDTFEQMARKGYQATHGWRMDENGYIPGQWWDKE